jgi:multidrug resistance efflux pump
MSQRWREFRITFLPLLVFSSVVGVIFLLWRETGITGYLAGMAEGVRAVVTSPQLGQIQQLRVQPYQMVEEGEPVAILQPRDPQAALGLLQSQVQIARLRMEPSVAERNAMNFEQIRIDLLQVKTELAIAKVNLERAENEVRRATPLFQEKIVSEDVYDLSVKTRDMYQAEVRTKMEAVAEIEKQMTSLHAMGTPTALAPNDPMNLLLTQLEDARLATATNWGPIVLRAPISGMINIVHRRAGENVVEGEPLIVINSAWADRIVGYLRQPYAVDPQVGMSVHVATRDQKARKFWTEISQVGAQLETITNSLAFIKQGSLADAGLPIVVEIPKGIRIRPGESVDLAFRARPAGLPAGPTMPATPEQPATPVAGDNKQTAKLGGL